MPGTNSNRRILTTPIRQSAWIRSVKSGNLPFRDRPQPDYIVVYSSKSLSLRFVVSKPGPIVGRARRARVAEAGGGQFLSPELCALLSDVTKDFCEVIKVTKK